VKHLLVDTEVLIRPFSIQELLEHALVFPEVLKQQFFNTRDAVTSTCISRGIETTTLNIRGTETYQIIFGNDRSLICLKTTAHITGLHDVKPS
jgi:hypothetical protein